MKYQDNRRAFLKKIGLGTGISVLSPAAFPNDEMFSENKKRPGPPKTENKLHAHPFNGYYTGNTLAHIAFPLGGIGAGMFCMEGVGSINHLSVDHRPDLYNEPFAFAAICVKGMQNGAKVLEAPVPGWKIFGPGVHNGTYGLPRFQEGRFLARFPFADLELEDQDIPLQVKLTGWSPFIPGDEDNSSLPIGVFEYQFKNPSNVDVDAVFSYNTQNFIDKNGKIIPEQNGFRLVKGNEAADGGTGFSIFVDHPNAVVDHCWFRGYWFDPQSILWKHIEQGDLVNNPPVEGSSPGASVYVPLNIPAGETKTVHVNFIWYLPQSALSVGGRAYTGPAFRKNPSSGKAKNQTQVSGFAGKQLVNTFDPGGDGQVGSLQSPPIKIEKRYLKFLIGGGNDPERTVVQLLKDGKVIRHVSGKRTESLAEIIWDLKDDQGTEGVIRIVDEANGPWGHILADQFVLTDDPEENLHQLSDDALLLADFEGNGYGNWKTIADHKRSCCADGSCETERYYKPWYATRFESLTALIRYWISNGEELKRKSALFRDTFYASTLPEEVMEAVAANLSILKSPTVLRQHDGKLWGWEGCREDSGCCPGSCTHVWNYAQSIPHLFPSMERSLRETEFIMNQDARGHQVFRANLPISKGIHNFHAAADGQLGGIMKLYRDWRISGDTEWMKNLYDQARKSLDYCIETWDPGRQGVLEEPHHNTYDIEFWGADGMCTSFYLGALAAMIRMSEALQKETELYRSLLEKGKEYLENQLFSGEYFIQQIRWNGLRAKNPLEVPAARYSPEEFTLLQKEGPKYQYGKGCLSDGVLGMWMASVCGLGEVVADGKVKSHLLSVYQYNLKKNLTDHVNPQRPLYANGSEGGLLLCSWPKGGKLSLPFVYSNEVWTGIEYQVAAHLMMKGEVEKGLEVVRECRNRYDGSLRNPFDEIECGHWYARAMSSYSMLQALTGVRYDAVDQILYIDSKIGDFTTFLPTTTGFGNVGLEDGKPFLKVTMGNIDVRKVLVSGKEKQLTQV